MSMVRRGRHERRQGRPAGAAALHPGVIGALLGVVLFLSLADASAPVAPGTSTTSLPTTSLPATTTAPSPPPAADPPLPSPLLAPYLTPEGERLAALERGWTDAAAVRDDVYLLEAEPAEPFPAVPAGSGHGRRIVYSNSRQRIWVVDAHDRILASYPVSGRRGVPRAGTYHVFSKDRIAWAGHGGITMRYMVRFARGANLAIGFHSIPIRADGRPLQTTEDLGHFRSAGCVRQSYDDAVRLFSWASLGTTVVVTR